MYEVLAVVSIVAIVALVPRLEPVILAILSTFIGSIFGAFAWAVYATVDGTFITVRAFVMFVVGGIIAALLWFFNRKE